MSDYEGRFYDAMSDNETLRSEIESLEQQVARLQEAEQQLATANTAFDVVQKDCWNLTEKVIPNLRQQLADMQETLKDHGEIQVSLCQQLAERDADVKLLRDAVREARTADDCGWCQGGEYITEVLDKALSATEPKP